MAITRKDLVDLIRPEIDHIFNETYRVFKEERYILEQCGKRYRVKDTHADPFERYKTDWLPLKQAQGFLKLLRGNEI